MKDFRHLKLYSIMDTKGKLRYLEEFIQMTDNQNKFVEFAKALYRHDLEDEHALAWTQADEKRKQNVDRFLNEYNLFWAYDSDPIPELKPITETVAKLNPEEWK